MPLVFVKTTHRFFSAHNVTLVVMNQSDQKSVNGLHLDPLEEKIVHHHPLRQALMVTHYTRLHTHRPIRFV